MYAYIVASMLLYFFSIGWPFAVLMLAMLLLLVGCMARSTPRKGVLCSGKTSHYVKLS
jgi:hypothetical protein